VPRINGRAPSSAEFRHVDRFRIRELLQRLLIVAAGIRIMSGRDSASSIASFSFIPTWVISSSVCAVSRYFWINDKKFASVTNGLTPWTSSSLNTLSAHHFLRLLAVRELHSGRTFQVTCPGEHFLPLS
jgi:hypothetical protein